MSGPEAPFAGFMDDYFSEAEEHLITMRRALLRLEEGLGTEVPRTLLDDLFRSVHSLKGISAMVELRDAELLAHHMESGLRAVREGEIELTAADIETLMAGAALLEHVVAARRAGTPPPSIAAVLESLAAVDPSSPAAAVRQPHAREGAPADRQPETAPPSVPTWRVTFVPSPQLVARGVTVDAIRDRLLSAGPILNAAPHVSDGGGISFHFHVALADPQLLEQLRDDGVTYERVAPGSVEPVAGRAGSGDAPVTAPSRRGWDAAPAPANLVRVDLARLDDLMRLVGDLVVARARLEDTLHRVEPNVSSHDWRALQEHSTAIERHLRDLREGVMRVRLVPVGEIFRRMPFVVRDLARETGKQVRLELAGQTTEIDKFLIERMMDPVLHLVRNAVSHGLEAPEIRIAAGKPAEGVIRLSAATVGESVVIEIADDGAGIDVQAVAERASAGGAGRSAGLDTRELLELISEPGFSTRERADRASGRGMGMAVVRTTIRELGGTVSLETAPGTGTSFTITLPLTLAITDAIIVHVGSQTFAVPQSAVHELTEVDQAAVRAMERHELLPYRGATVPVVRLANAFGIPAAPRPRLHAVIVGAGEDAVALLVDRIAGQREIVVKTIVDPLIRVRGVSGATELGDGRLVLILDVAALRPGRRDSARSAREVPA